MTADNERDQTIKQAAKLRAKLDGYMEAVKPAREYVVRKMYATIPSGHVGAAHWVGVLVRDIDIAENRADRAVAETAALRDAIRALHRPHVCTGYPDCNPLFGGGCAHAGDCRECRREHPCPTIRALDGGQP